MVWYTFRITDYRADRSISTFPEVLPSHCGAWRGSSVVRPGFSTWSEKPMRQGQGLGTARKEQGFAALFKFSLTISRNEKVMCYPYWHVDFNCGSGLNERVECDGSPLVFLTEAVRANRPVHAYFCDSDP